MMPIALLPLAIIPNLLLGNFFNGPVVDAFCIATLLTWGGVSCAAMSLGCVESIRYFRRRFAVLYPRFWCEIARLAWHGIFIGFITMMTISCVAGIFKAAGLETFTWSIAMEIPGYCRWMFLFAAGTVYTLSLLRWTWPTGRAAECVHFFLPLIVSGSIFDYVLDNWPLVSSGRTGL